MYSLLLFRRTPVADHWLREAKICETHLLTFSSRRRRCRRLERYPLQVRHKQDWDRGFMLLLPQTAALLESDADSGVIKPASSSSFKTLRPRAPCGARCIGNAVSTWSAVCSEAPHSQFGERARPHFCAWTNLIAQHQSAGG